MWRLRRTEKTDRFMRFESPATWAETLSALAADAAAHRAIDDAIVAAPYRALRFETPAVTRSSLGRPFEFVLVDSPGLDRPADPSAFVSHFTGEPVVTFANLGADATLVVPAPEGPDVAYPHLAAFIREAAVPQIDALWRSIAEAMLARVDDRPVWLNTAGAGVPWLHVRLDDRPKYYRHAPYRTVPS